MPHETEEEGKESQPTRSSFSIVRWWRKFHFSGRVIACSVLLGLGLVLIGGLIFAINLADDNSKPEADGTSGQVPTKAPSNYTGPVVMGIGGFIVVMGVTMCLFETQVCRKRTGDSSPLISERTDDPERKDSDPAPGPSTSNDHPKNHRHGARKNCTSPRKSKCRHAKSHSKERNQQKSPSPKSPPVAIEPSKNFMTSSEDNFLTPPNTLEANANVVVKEEYRKSEAEQSALMKSFTSSDPSWNQSAEFLTPSTSFRDSSVSVNNSVEIEENQNEKKLKTTELSEKESIDSEYMTPLTVEEDRIQQLLIRVKNEQKQMACYKKETGVGTSEFSRPDDNTSSSQVQMDIVKNDKEMGEEFESENNSSDKFLPESTSASKDVNQEPAIQMEKMNDRELSQNKFETNEAERNVKVVHNETVNEISAEVVNAAEEKNLTPHDTQEIEISSESDSTSLTKESKAPDSDKGTSHGSVQENDVQVDIESSTSSDETVVSPDSFQENPINNGASSEKTTLSTLEENSNDKSKCLSTSESPDNDTTAVDNHEVVHPNIQENLPHQDEAGTHDLNLSEKDDVQIAADGVEKVSKDESS